MGAWGSAHIAVQGAHIVVRQPGSQRRRPACAMPRCDPLLASLCCAVAVSSAGRAIGATADSTASPMHMAAAAKAFAYRTASSLLSLLQSLVGTDNFTHILRVLNTNVDGKQKIMYALTAIRGIGRRFSNICCKKAEVDLNKR